MLETSSVGYATKLKQRKDAVSESVADECIIINLANGNYHRTTGVASKLWERLAQPVSFGDWLSGARQEDSSIDEAGLARFGLDLIENDLLEPETGAAEALAPLAAPKSAQASAALSLETYDDMADLLLLDPIHEVGEHGWPNRPDPAA